MCSINDVNLIIFSCTPQKNGLRVFSMQAYEQKLQHHKAVKPKLQYKWFCFLFNLQRTELLFGMYLISSCPHMRTQGRRRVQKSVFQHH